MARPLRLEFENALYHVTSRGDRREDIYWSDEDRVQWIDLLSQVCQRFNWRVYAYCLMTNHYHLLVQTPEGNLSAGMRQLNGVYTQLSNRRHQRTGHVFQGRFKAILVNAESHLLELVRYVVLNPVRAKMVDAVQEWPWSSYLATVAPVHLSLPDWLMVDEVLAHFGSNPQTKDFSLEARALAQKRYATFVNDGIGQASVWEQLKGQMYLGDSDFISKMGQKIEQIKQLQSNTRWTEVPLRQHHILGKTIEDYAAQYPDNRNEAIKAAFATRQFSMSAIAQHFELHYTSVSRIINGK